MGIRSNKLSGTLFVVYIIALTWVILLKMGFSFSDLLLDERVLNLVPFGEIDFGSVRLKDLSEIISNILVFIPFGIFICLVNPKSNFFKWIWPIIVTTILFECLQYLFGIGIADTTDIIANTAGGAVGIGVYGIIHLLFKDNTQKVINIIALICTVGMLVMIATLLISNLRHF